MAVLIGCSSNRYTTFETKLGEKLGIIRQFCQDQDPIVLPPVSGNPYKTASDLSKAGYVVCLSFNNNHPGGSPLGNWQGDSQGLQDAKYQHIAQYLENKTNFPVPGVWCYNHEPEYQGVAPTYYKEAAARVQYLMKQYAPSWFSSIILMEYTFRLWRNTPPTRDPNNYWPTPSTVPGDPPGLGGTDMVGIDFYDERGANDNPGNLYAHFGNAFLGPQSIAGGTKYPLDWAASKGAAYWMVPEVGVPIVDPLVDPNDWTKQRDWFQQFSNLWRNDPRFYGIMNFEHDGNDNPPYANRALAGGHDPSHPETMAAYRSIGNADSRPVDSPTVLSSVAVIHSSTAAAVYNSAPFEVGPNELLLLWTEAEHGVINPGVPSMSFPTAPTSGTAPTFSRIAAADNGWASQANGGVNAAQGLWVASTASSGPASGCVLRVTFPASLGGCTVIMERIVGANLSGTPAAALVGSPVKSAPAVGPGASVTLPAPANARNRGFSLATHRMNEQSTPGAGIKTATLIGSGGSMTPVTGKLHLAAVYMADGGGTPPQVSSITGCSLTWTLINRSIDSGGQGTVEVWQGVGATPTTGTPVVTTNLGGGLSFLRTHFIDIASASGIGNVMQGILPTGQGAFGYTTTMPYQQPNSGLFTVGLVAQNGAAVMTPLSTTSISGTGGAQGVTDEFGRFEVWRATFDDARPTNPGFSWLESHYMFSALFVEILGIPALAEGVDVTRTSPAAIGVATAHSVGAFQPTMSESWATSSLGAMMAVEVAAGAPSAGERLGSTSAHVDTFETMLGRSVDSQRVAVADSAAIVNWGAGGWLTAAQADAAGRSVFVSAYIGTNTFAQIAAGNQDVYLQGIATNLGALGQLGVFCYFPEPEANPGRGSSAQFRSAMQRVISVMRPLMPGWRFAVTLQDVTFFGFPQFTGTPYAALANGKVPTDWLVPEAEVLAVNAFNRKGAAFATPYAQPASPTYADMPMSLFCDPMANTAGQNAKYLMLAEFGCTVDDPAVNPNGHTARATFIGNVMSYLKGRAELVHYADLDNLDGRINMRITGGAAAAEQDSVDAFKSGANAVSLTLTNRSDAIVRKAQTKTHTVTAIVRAASVTRTQTADAVVKRPFVLSHTTDAILTKGGLTRSHQTDTFITPYVLVSHVTSSSAASVSSLSVG